MARDGLFYNDVAAETFDWPRSAPNLNHGSFGSDRDGLKTNELRGRAEWSFIRRTRLMMESN